ncbi:MAG TPA: hypothetical protein VGN12_26610 [Pirellulales bacterium]
MADRQPLVRAMRYPYETSDERRARLIRIRQEIAAGTYETSARMSAAVAALASELKGRVNLAGKARRRPK